MMKLPTQSIILFSMIFIIFILSNPCLCSVNDGPELGLDALYPDDELCQRFQRLFDNENRNEGITNDTQGEDEEDIAYKDISMYCNKMESVVKVQGYHGSAYLDISSTDKSQFSILIQIQAQQVRMRLMPWKYSNPLDSSVHKVIVKGFIIYHQPNGLQQNLIPKYFVLFSGEASNDNSDDSTSTIEDSVPYAWTASTTRILLVRVKPLNGKLDPVDMNSLISATKQVSDFYISNSGGSQPLQFTIYPDVFTTTKYMQMTGDHTLTENNANICCTCIGSRGSYSYPLVASVLDEVISYFKSLGTGLETSYDRIGLILPTCSSLNWFGMGQVGDKAIFLNGFTTLRSLATVMAHELGHTNGAQHASLGNIEYGDDWTLMGNFDVAVVPKGHFSIAAKVAFGWVQHERKQIITLTKSTNSCTTNSKYLAGGCFTSGTYWIEAHDAGLGYTPGKIYGLRILTDKINQDVFVEFRGSTYASISFDPTPGVLLTWCPMQDYIKQGRHGPTQIVDYVSSTPLSSQDSKIPLGAVYVYDLDNVGAVIRVLSHDPAGNRIQVSVEFAKPTIVNDYLLAISSPSKQATATPTIKAISYQGSLECDDTRSVTVPATKGLTMLLFNLQVDNPSKVYIESTMCPYLLARAGSLSPNAGIYVYDTFPLHLTLAANAAAIDPRINSIWYNKFKCLDGSSSSIQLPQAAVLDDRYTSQYNDVGQYMYKKFSKYNYVVFYFGEDKGSSSSSTSEDTSRRRSLRLNDKILPYIRYSSDCQLIRCVASAYFSEEYDDCTNCPFGTVSDAGSTSINDCYTSCDSISVISSKLNYQAVYKRLSDSSAISGGKPIYKKDNFPSITWWKLAIPDIKYGSDSSLSFNDTNEYYLFRGQGSGWDFWWYIDDSPVSSINKNIVNSEALPRDVPHPVLLSQVNSLDDTSFTFRCACTSPFQYIRDDFVANDVTKQCGTCPKGKISVTNGVGINSCFTPCLQIQIKVMASDVKKNDFIDGTYVVDTSNVIIHNGYPVFTRLPSFNLAGSEYPSKQLWVGSSDFDNTLFAWKVGNNYKRDNSWNAISQGNLVSWPSLVTSWKASTQQKSVYNNVQIQCLTVT